MSNYAKRKQAEALQKKQNSKKTMISVAIFVLVVIALVLFFWFGKQLRKNNNTASGDPNYDVFDYVTLGQYEGVEVYRIKPEVTDEDVQDVIDGLLEDGIEYGEFDDRGVESGDKVTIDFVGKVDGEEFEGGTSEGYTYVLGGGSMIEGFDEAIYGMKAGEERTINVTFPEDYKTTELAGQPAVFEITMEKTEEVTYQPEWNDEFVKKYSEEEYSTTTEYEEAIRADLLEQAESTSESRLANDIWTAVYENATIDGYPEYVYNTIYLNLSSSLESTASAYGITVEQYLSIFAGGMTLNEYVMSYVNSQLVTEALIKTMGLELSDEKYEELATAELEYYGVDSISELEEQYGEETLRNYYLNQLLNEKLEEMSVITDVTQDEYNELTAETETE